MILHAPAPQACAAQSLSIPPPGKLALQNQPTLSGFSLSQPATSVSPLATGNERREGWIDGDFGALLNDAGGSSLWRSAVVDGHQTPLPLVDRAAVVKFLQQDSQCLCNTLSHNCRYNNVVARYLLPLAVYSKNQRGHHHKMT